MKSNAAINVYINAVVHSPAISLSLLKWLNYRLSQAILMTHLTNQLELLKTWFDNDAEGCLNYWGTDQAKQFLEIIGDAHILYVTDRLSQLQRKQLAKELLQTVNSEKI